MALLTPPVKGQHMHSLASLDAYAIITLSSGAR